MDEDVIWKLTERLLQGREDISF